MRAKALVLVTAVAAALLTAPQAPANAAGAPFDSRPAQQALTRLIGPRYASQVTLRATRKGTGKDRFRVSADHGRLVVEGTSPAVELTGFGWYLKYVAHANIELEGSQLNLPPRLALPAQPIEHTASVDNRFALNDTNEGYAGAYLTWQQWQHRIDVLALHGINEVLVYEGQEAVYERAFQQFHYTAAQMRSWIPQPGHQPWWLLQNMCCLGSPISQQLIDRRAVLGRQIADQLRSLGMTPVLPGYYGTVPAGFSAKNPGAHTVPQGIWAGLERPDWLDPTDPFFAKVAAAFYQVQTHLFGPSTMYKMDLLHEGGIAGPVDVAARFAGCPAGAGNRASGRDLGHSRLAVQPAASDPAGRRPVEDVGAGRAFRAGLGHRPRPGLDRYAVCLRHHLELRRTRQHGRRAR